MRFYALATDYDGTLATHGVLADSTLGAIRELQKSGRRAILVTGRELADLKNVCPHLDAFDFVVAENGALLYRPADGSEKSLGDAPSQPFIEQLQRRGVAPFSVGRVIAATWHPHETTVLEIIRDLGLELQVVFNKGAVMILPSGINKATGLAAALREMELSPRNVVAIGDAENDHAFMSQCECAVAVANALPAVIEHADWVTGPSHGAGVEELIRRMIETDLAELDPHLERHGLSLGMLAQSKESAEEFRISPHGHNMLVAGPSGSGKSTFIMAFIEQLLECQYQFCIIDPEGDYMEIPNTVVTGGFHQPPSLEEIDNLLRNPEQNTVINLMGLNLEQRPAFFNSLFMHLLELRARTGRPHWIVIDEAHHLLKAQANSENIWPGDLTGVVLITIDPNHISPGAMQHMDYVTAVGSDPTATFRAFGEAAGIAPLKEALPEPAPDELYVWDCCSQPDKSPPDPVRLKRPAGKQERRRHIRKYMEGELLAPENFYFRGPDGKLNLWAQNLQIFMQLAQGVDEITWEFHRRRHDYSAWFRGCIKDEELAEAAQRIEDSDATPADSREQSKAEIEKRYTAPA